MSLGVVNLKLASSSPKPILTVFTSLKLGTSKPRISEVGVNDSESQGVVYSRRVASQQDIEAEVCVRSLVTGGLWKASKKFTSVLRDILGTVMRWAKIVKRRIRVVRKNGPSFD